MLGGDGVDVKAAERAGAGTGAKVAACGGVVEKAEGGGSQGRRVAKGREEAEGAVKEGLAVYGYVGSDDGQGGEHGLDEGAGVAFIERREDK